MEGDDQFWFSNAAHVACLFQNKVKFLLKIMLIFSIEGPTFIKRLLDDTPWVAA